MLFCHLLIEPSCEPRALTGVWFLQCCHMLSAFFLSSTCLTAKRDQGCVFVVWFCLAPSKTLFFSFIACFCCLSLEIPESDIFNRSLLVILNTDKQAWTLALLLILSSANENVLSAPAAFIYAAELTWEGHTTVDWWPLALALWCTAMDILSLTMTPLWYAFELGERALAAWSDCARVCAHPSLWACAAVSVAAFLHSFAFPPELERHAGLQKTDYRPLEQSLSVCLDLHVHMSVCTCSLVKMCRVVFRCVFKPEVINTSPLTACGHLLIRPHHLSLVTICGHFYNLSVDSSSCWTLLSDWLNTMWQTFA